MTRTDHSDRPKRPGHDARTLAFYEENAARYGRETEPPHPPRRLVDFAARLPEGGFVLDLGAGSGWAAEFLATLGHRVIALDAAAAMARMAGERAGVLAIRAGFDEVHGREVLDGIWACHALQHAPRDLMPVLLVRLGATLRPGGWFHLDLHEARPDEPLTLRDTLGRLYNHYTGDEIRQLLAAAGLDIHAFGRKDEHGFDGRPITTMSILARREGDAADG